MKSVRFAAGNGVAVWDFSCRDDARKTAELADASPRLPESPGR